MHIADGILSWPVLVTGAALSAAGVAWGLSKLRHEDLPKAACVSSAFFVASLIHVPVGPASAHLILAGLSGILLGPAVFPALLVGLLLQALLFQFGGFLSLGVNCFNMAFPAMLCGLLFQRALASTAKGWRLMLLGFSAGFLGVALASMLTSSALLLSGGDFRHAALLLFAGHIPVMVAEGVATAFAAAALKKLRPETFDGPAFDLKTPHTETNCA